MSIFVKQNMDLELMHSSEVSFFKVRAAGFLPGVLLFSDLSFEKFSPGFYFFPKSKNSFAGSYFFLEFSHIVCCF